MRRIFRSLACMAAVAAMFATPAAAQDYPTKPIQLVLGYSPGGSVDIMSRFLGERLSALFGQQVVVENKPGGGTVIASELVARAAPDGYTLMNADIAHGANPALQPSLPYDTVKDFAPISLLIRFPAVLVVPKDSPVKSVQELIDLAKSEPGKLNYSSAGVGGMNFLASELFKLKFGLDIAHIPYKSGGEALQALLGNFVDILFTTVPPVVPQLEKVRVLAVSADERLPALPDVPTFAELGFPGFSVQLWQGFLAPAGTDRAIIDKIHDALVKVLAEPEVGKRIADLGGLPVGSTPEEFQTFIDAEIAKWKEVITPEMRAQ